MKCYPVVVVVVVVSKTCLSYKTDRVQIFKYDICFCILSKIHKAYAA